MEGRNYIPPDNLNPRNQHLLVNHRLLHQMQPSRLSSADLRVLEDRIAAQRYEIQTLLRDNQRLAVTHVTLKQEMAAAEQERRLLSATAASVKAERGTQVRDVYLRSLKAEEEVRSVDGVNADLDRIRTDIQELRGIRDELLQRLKDINVNIARSHIELQEFTSIKAEIESTNNEIEKGRFAIENERKMFAKNCELSEPMKKHMVSMANDAEKLRFELANAERRAMAGLAAAAATVTPAESYASSVPPGSYDLR